MISMSWKEKEAFYRTFCQADFLNFPNEFKCIEAATQPNFPIELTITYKGSVKKSTFWMIAAIVLWNKKKSNTLKN